MDEQVHITFSQHLNAGETFFQVPVPQQYLDKDRKFGIEFLSLVPDYHSKQAVLYNMDPESEKTSLVESTFTIDFEIDGSFYQTNPWEQAQENVSMGIVIQSFNNHFLRTKPTGCIFPLVYIDWYHLDVMGLDSAASLEFYKRMAIDLYGEPFDELKHLGNGPTKMREFKTFNGLLFPTTSNNPTLTNKIRVCLWIAPNTKVAFSNYDLPIMLGFTDNRLPEKRVNRQVAFFSASMDNFSTPRCDGPPTMHVAKGMKTNKVHVYMLSKTGTSKPGRLLTTLSRMHSSIKVAEDYNKAIQYQAQRLNFHLQFLYDVVQKRFRFVYPASQLIRLAVNVTTRVAMQLGFGPTEQILPQMVAQVVVENDENLQEKALALVLDTRMVVVNLEQCASQHNFHFNNTLMAILEPDSLGILTTKRNMSLPRVPVSYYNPTLEFALRRFDELGKPINLEWKVGAHIQGVLSGNV